MIMARRGRLRACIMMMFLNNSCFLYIVYDSNSKDKNIYEL
jgi:hypothetical protein